MPEPASEATSVRAAAELPTATETVNGEEAIGSVNPVAAAVSVRLTAEKTITGEKVAKPVLPDDAVAPELIRFAERERVIDTPEAETGLLKASSTWTVRAGNIAMPAIAFEGC